MEEENIISIIKNNPDCYDRFTFDKYMRLLITAGYSREEANDYILANCFLSTLVYQERIENKYYLDISNKMSPDLVRLKKEIASKFSSWKTSNN